MKTSKPGVVYVAVQPARGSVKVGCMLVGSRRLRRLSRYGWTLHRSLNLASVDLARDIEQAVLFDIRHRLLIPAHLTADELPNGWTETASAALISASSLWDLVGEQAGAQYLAPVVQKASPRRAAPAPFRRTPGDAPRFSQAARAAAAYAAKNTN